MTLYHLTAIPLLLALAFAGYVFLAARGKAEGGLFPLRFVRTYAVLCAVGGIAAILIYLYECYRIEQPFMQSCMDAAILIWMLIIACIDWEEHIVPNRLVLIGVAAWLLLTVLEVSLGKTPLRSVLLFSLIGFAVTGIVLLAVALIVKSALGMGDVKLFATLGLFYGLSGAYSILLGTVIVMALTSVALLLLKRVTAKTALPMAPFACVGLLIYLLAGVS